MKNTRRTLLTAAAITGLLNGAAIHQSFGQGTNTNAAPGKIASAATSPKVQDCAGTNDCKALGGCKTDAHACKFKNSCKGQGGCHLTKKDIQDWEKQQKADKAKATTGKSA